MQPVRASPRSLESSLTSCGFRQFVSCATKLDGDKRRCIYNYFLKNLPGGVERLLINYSGLWSNFTP